MDRRLSRLKGKGKYFRILALDHGLTTGFGDEVPSRHFNEILRECIPFIDSVVMNYGMTPLISETSDPHLILQCFGAPKGHRRVKVTSVESAVYLDAAAVSIQLDLGVQDLSDHTREVASFVHEAHNVGMPVLFMVSGHDVTCEVEVAKAIRVSQELGADFIKTSLSIPANGHSVEGEVLTRVLEMSPPVVLAGGQADTALPDRLRMAIKLGFSGYCVGRSIFAAPNPATIAASLNDALNSK